MKKIKETKIKKGKIGSFYAFEKFLNVALIGEQAKMHMKCKNTE